MRALILATALFLTGCISPEYDDYPLRMVADKIVRGDTLYLADPDGSLCAVDEARFNATEIGREVRCDWTEETP